MKILNWLQPQFIFWSLKTTDVVKQQLIGKKKSIFLCPIVLEQQTKYGKGLILLYCTQYLFPAFNSFIDHSLFFMLYKATTEEGLHETFVSKTKHFLKAMSVNK